MSYVIILSNMAYNMYDYIYIYIYIYVRIHETKNPGQRDTTGGSWKLVAGPQWIEVLPL